MIRAMHAGSYFGEHGHIVERAELRALAPGQPRPAVAGQRLTVASGSMLTVSLAMVVPEKDYKGEPNRIDTVELIGIAGGR
ncbi:MAG: hypothetical protein QM736_06730 [Vicinamibacterales bacterium]